MKFTIFFLLVLGSQVTLSQTREQRLSKDSVKYYQTQLNKLYRSTYDSLRNSEEYKFLRGKLASDKSAENFGVQLSFPIGFQKNDYININHRLDSLGLNPLNSSIYSIGIGLSFRFKVLIIGYDMNVLIRKNTGGSYLHLYASTNVIKIKRFILSPEIGIGEQGIIHRYKTSSSATDFNGYLNSSANKVEIEHDNTMVDYALAIKLYPKKDNSIYLPLLRLGYRYGLKEKNWKIKDGVSTNAPFDRNNNFYVQLILGFGE